MISIQVSLIQVQSIPKKKFLLNRAPKWRFKSSLCFLPALALEQTKSIFRNIKLSPSITALLLVLFHNGSSYFCDQGPTSLLTSQSVSSFAQSCLTLRDSKDHSPSGLPIQHQLPEFTQTHVHWVSDAIQPSHPVVPFSLLQSFPASGSFPMSQLCIRWPKYWSFSFTISLSNEYLRLISFRIDWLDILAVQGILKSFLQHHSSKASILQHSAFFIVQVSHPYMTTGKTIVLTRWTFVGKVTSLLFNMLSRLFITFLPRSKRLLISWLQSPSAVVLETKKN